MVIYVTSFIKAFLLVKFRIFFIFFILSSTFIDENMIFAALLMRFITYQEHKYIHIEMRTLSGLRYSN